MFLELGDNTQRGKERFPFFYIQSVPSFLVGIYVSDKTRNCCDLHIQIMFLAIRQQKFIWSLNEELSGVRPKVVVMSK